MSSDPQPAAASPWLLRLRDQAAVAGLVLISLMAMGGWYVAQGGCQGRLIEFDAATPQTARFQIDINTADWSELVVLPDIGPAIAQRIIDDRAAGGPFQSPDDLLRVRGIGPKTLEGLRPYLLPIDLTTIVHEEGVK